MPPGKKFSLALKLERNNSQHLQNIPLLLEINYLYKKLHASTIAFIFSTTQGFNPVSHYKKQTHCLIQVEQGGTGMGVLTITEKYKNNIRHGLFQQHFFSQANISFPFVIFFFNCSWVSNTLAWHSLVVLYKMGLFTPCYWYFWHVATVCSLQDWLLIWLIVVYRDLQE